MSSQVGAYIQGLKEAAVEEGRKYRYRETWFLDITWEKEAADRLKLPGYVGPFPSKSDALAWGDLNIPNGSFHACSMSWPYGSGGVVL